MKLLVIGYGKMGKAIEKIALDRGHQIIATINNLASLEESISDSEIDVALEFSNPESAFLNISTCLNHKIKVISGTTGWLEHFNEIENICNQQNGTFLHSSNFSIGVNIVFALNKKLAKLAGNKTNYKISIEEIHHTEKKDSPSGTAIKLAEDIILLNPHLSQWVNQEPNNSNQLAIISKREANVPGTHRIKYQTNLESIEIEHEAFDRKVFAEGALLVAEWIQNKNGFLTMDEFLNN